MQAFACGNNYIKENLSDTDLESVEFQALKFTEFLIGRVIFFYRIVN